MSDARQTSRIAHSMEAVLDTWSDGRIMHKISDVATDPRIPRRAGDGPDFLANGTRGGVDVEVLIRNGEIWTGYPTNLPRNPL